MSELGAVNAPHALVMDIFGFQALASPWWLWDLQYRGLSKGWDIVVGTVLILLAGVSMIVAVFFHLHALTQWAFFIEGRFVV